MSSEEHNDTSKESLRRKPRRSEYVKLSDLIAEHPRPTQQAVVRSRVLEALESGRISGFELADETTIRNGTKVHIVFDICLYNRPGLQTWIEEMRLQLERGNSKYYRPTMQMVINGDVDFRVAERSTVEAIRSRRRHRAGSQVKPEASTTAEEAGVVGVAGHVSQEARPATGTAPSSSAAVPGRPASGEEALSEALATSSGIAGRVPILPKASTSTQVEETPPTVLQGNPALPDTAQPDNAQPDTAQEKGLGDDFGQSFNAAFSDVFMPTQEEVAQREAGQLEADQGVSSNSDEDERERKKIEDELEAADLGAPIERSTIAEEPGITAQASEEESTEETDDLLSWASPPSPVVPTSVGGLTSLSQLSRRNRNEQ